MKILTLAQEEFPLHPYLRKSVRLAQVNSTMDAAKIEAKGTHFCWVSAQQQTRGRGSKSRVWESPIGNLYATLTLPLKGFEPRRLAWLPLELGIHIHDIVGEFLPSGSRSSLVLKWPNDLLWENRKLAGFLIEADSEQLHIGLGVNLRFAPQFADGGSDAVALEEILLRVELGGTDPILPEKTASARVLNPEDLEPKLVHRFYSVLGQGRSLRPPPPGLLETWSAKVDWGSPRRLRDRPGNPWVSPLALDQEGRLKVRFADGSEEWLISDYLI
jgi:biotin-(acetyl-CoA carboxylase) ligase